MAIQCVCLVTTRQHTLQRPVQYRVSAASTATAVSEHTHTHTHTHTPQQQQQNHCAHHSLSFTLTALCG
jgi:hypothetical protein